MQRCPPAKRNSHACGLWYYCHQYTLDTTDRLRRWNSAHLGAIRPSQVDKCVPDGSISYFFSDFNVTPSKFDGSFRSIWTHRRRKNWYWVGVPLGAFAIGAAVFFFFLQRHRKQRMNHTQPSEIYVRHSGPAELPSKSPRSELASPSTVRHELA